MKNIKKEIQRRRDYIDRIDVQLVRLLNKRANYAKEIGKLKVKVGVSAHCPKREREVIQNISAINHGPLSIKAIRRLFERIIDESKNIEHTTMNKIKKRNA